jgi:hypothetical protein
MSDKKVRLKYCYGGWKLITNGKNAASNLKIRGLQSKDVEIKIKEAVIASTIMRIG